MGGFILGGLILGGHILEGYILEWFLLGMYIVEGILKGILDGIFWANRGPSEAKTVPTCIPCKLINVKKINCIFSILNYALLFVVESAYIL